MKLRIKKAISFSLAVALSASLIVIPAPSASASAIVSVIGSVLADSSVKGLVMDLTSKFASWALDQVLNGSSDSDFPDTFWTPSLKDRTECVFVSESSFQEIIAYLHSSGISVSPVYIDGLGYVLQCTNSTFKHPNTGETHTLYGIQGNYLTYSTGYMIVYAGSSGLEFSNERQDQWLPFSSATSKKQVSVLTKDSLSDLCVTINQTDRTCSVRDTYINGKRFYIIIDPSNNIYANADGVPYVAHYEATVTEEKFDYIVNEGDTIVNEGDDITNNEYTTVIEGSTTNYEIIDNSQLIDMSNGTFTYIGGVEIDNSSNDTYNEIYKEEFCIDELIYDFSTQNYQVNTYDVIYNEDNDSYETNFYDFSATYNITNVYVTNIGQTELYKPFELYYALPDGRSSADLTAEEIVGMSFEFADCVNYAKSATDTYLRALYHFDGNTDDSSYFSTQGKFEWLSGASISYMDVGTFDGALYLGPENHSFRITLPGGLGSDDFTIQFRYYQAGSADTQANIENSISIGGNVVYRWDESNLYSSSSTSACSALSVGSWVELAVIRNSGTTYLYHNGLNVASFADTTVYTGNIVLTLGGTTRAYSMLDELRVVNFAVAENGGPYTCTSVPYDTNAVLVIPDPAYLIADEFWEVTSSRTNLLNYSVGSLTSGAVPEEYSSHSAWSKVITYFPSFRWHTTYTDVSAHDGFMRISNVSDKTPEYILANYYGNMKFAFSSTVFAHETDSSYIDGTHIIDSFGDYCFSVVLSDGTVCSLPFTINAISSTENYPVYKAFSWGWLAFADYALDSTGVSYSQIGIAPFANSCVDIIYMELVKGSSTDLTAEKVSCMYSSEEVKPNTAAIQTDIPIKGYTVGGVRPTFPARGDVWMPVSNNRITNVYLYNGSAWEEVNARWYTGTRWIPIYGFDITTLEDCWDIADIDTTIVLIGSESQFWSWLQGAWQKMLDKLDAIIIALGGDPDYTTDSPGSGGGGLWTRIKNAFSDALGSIIESLMSFITDVLQLVLDLVYDLLAFFFDFLSTEVVTGIANLFSSFTDGSLLVFFQQEITGTDDDGNEVTTTIIGLPDGITTAFAFFAGVIMILPEELRNLLIFGVGALILIGILKLAKS